MPEAAVAVVVEKKLLAARMSEGREPTRSVAAGDSVAVRVLRVVEPIGRVELPACSIGFAQSENASDAQQRSVVTGSRCVGRRQPLTRALREEAVCAQWTAHNHALPEIRDRDVPVVSPTPTERAKTIAREYRLTENASEHERESRRWRGRVHRADEIADGMQRSRSLEHFKVKQVTRFIRQLVDCGEVIHVVAHREDVICPKWADVLRKILPDRVPAIGSYAGRQRGGFE